jgi:hypothetical protein
MRADHLLVRCRLRGADGLAAALRRWCEGSGLALQPLRAAWSAASSVAYAYAVVPDDAAVSARPGATGCDRAW